MLFHHDDSGADEEPAPGSQTILVAQQAGRNDTDLDDDPEHNDDRASVGARASKLGRARRDGRRP
jgi:hypothetical protein